MTHIQVQVHKFFTDATGAKGLQNAILGWQEIQGYIHPSVTVNWMAIAQDNDIKYRGDLDMQNGFATGRYEIEAGLPQGFTLTAADGFGVIMGFEVSLVVGSINQEPIPGNALELFYSRNDTHTTILQFDGDVSALVAGKVPVIDGVPMVLTTPWTVAMGKTAAESNIEYFLTSGAKVITWQ